MTLERDHHDDGEELLRVVEGLISHIALLMRVVPDFKDIQSQASGFKSVVDFKWAEALNRLDIQLQECSLFEDHSLLRSYKYHALLQFSSVFIFSFRFLSALSDVKYPYKCWSILAGFQHTLILFIHQ